MQNEENQKKLMNAKEACKCALDFNKTMLSDRFTRCKNIINAAAKKGYLCVKFNEYLDSSQIQELREAGYEIEWEERRTI